MFYYYLLFIINAFINYFK